MITHNLISDEELRNKIRLQAISLGGNKRLKIYGTINCYSGKRMNRENRVFFASESEAKFWGYRPCGHCMKEGYRQWISLGRQ
jgi:methylphosphotriester-DNA--protein-cysteine methyltransferase